MKKFLILFTILLFAFSSIGQWSVGGRAGLNLATLTGKYYEDDSKSGWIATPVFGAVGNYEYTDMISFNAELLFLTIGSKTEYSYEGERNLLSEYEHKLTERYYYIQMPLLVRFTFGSGGILFYGNAGPYFGYKIGGKYKLDQNGQITEGKLRFNEDKLEENDWLFDPDHERRFDFGMYIGGGATRELGPGRIEADLRLGIGFLDHNKIENEPEGYKSFRTMNICLTIAYMYPFGKDQATRYLDE